MPTSPADDRPLASPPGSPAVAARAAISLPLLLSGLATVAAMAAPAADPQALLNAGQAAQALQWVEEQSSLSPWDTRLIAQRAMLLSLLHRDQQALKLLEEMAARYPNEPASHNLIALIHVGSGDFDSARTAAQRALRADVGYVPALKTLAEIETRLARQFYDHAARLDRGGDPTLVRKATALGDVIGNARASAFAQPGALLTLAPAPPADSPRLTRSGSPANGDDGLTITVSRPPDGGSASAAATPLVALATVPTARAGVLVSAPAAAGPAAASALQSHDGGAAPTFASVAGGGVAAAGFFGVPKLTVAALNAVDTLGTPTVRGQWQAAGASAGGTARLARQQAQPPATGATQQAAAAVLPTTSAAAAPARQPVAGGVAPAESQAAVDTALRRWATAWSRRDVAAYLAAYDAGFSGRFTSANGGRAAWERERTERIGERASAIKVELSDVAITVDGDQAQARFRQHYQSGKLASVDRKTLYWQRQPGVGWVIKREIVDG